MSSQLQRVGRCSYRATALALPLESTTNNKNLRTRLTILLTVVAFAALAGCGGSNEKASDSSSTTADVSVPATQSPTTTVPSATTIDITVAGGKVTTVSKRPAVERGATVQLRLTADVVDEVHLHGYDKSVDTVPGTAVTLEFVADIAGVFEVELEKTGKQLINLEVKD